MPAQSSDSPGPEFSGTVVVVTGAGGGIGRAIALRLARDGAFVVAADRRAEPVEETCRQLLDAGGRGEWRAVDVSGSGEVQRLIGDTAERHGSLGILVSNAGVSGPQRPIAEYDEVLFDRLVAVNLKGVFLGLRHALPIMISQGFGRILNIASVTAVRTVPGLGPYAATKHGIVALTRAAAVEAGPSGVRVNALLPGATDTAMVNPPGTVGHSKGFADGIPVGRLATPEEQAEVAAFVLSPRAGYLNGSSVLVDGGMAWA